MLHVSYQNIVLYTCQNWKSYNVFNLTKIIEIAYCFFLMALILPWKIGRPIEYYPFKKYAESHFQKKKYILPIFEWMIKQWFQMSNVKFNTLSFSCNSQETFESHDFTLNVRPTIFFFLHKNQYSHLCLGTELHNEMCKKRNQCNGHRSWKKKLIMYETYIYLHS